MITAITPHIIGDKLHWERSWRCVLLRGMDKNEISYPSPTIKIIERKQKMKSITSQIDALQAENESLQSLKKLFDKACKNEFGYGIKDLHKIVESHETYMRRKSAQQGQRNQLEHSDN